MLHAYVPTHGAGAEGMAHALLRHLVHCGHEVDVILSQVDNTVPEDYVYQGVRVHVHTGKTQTPNWIAEHHPHVIVCHLENTSRAAVLGKMFEVPVVQLLHNHRPETMTSTLQHRFAMVVCNSSWMVEEYEQYWQAYLDGRPGPRVLKIRPPVHPDEFAMVRTNKPGDRITLINLTVPKGAHVFYELAKRLPQYKFLGVRGAYGVQVIRDDLPNVEILDHQLSHEMGEVYARTKVLLVPSDYESYGRVAAEACCCGIPVIAHPTAGLRESLGGMAGIFRDRDAVGAWEKELRRLHAPRAWAAASKNVLEWSRALDPTEELAQWCSAMEEVARVPAAAGHAG